MHLTRRAVVAIITLLPLSTPPASAGMEGTRRKDGMRTSRNVVREVQAALLSQGFDPKGIDGVMGANTASAIRAFQADRSMPVTGEIDQPLLVALGLVAGF